MITMSAFGPKQTRAVAPHMSAFWGKSRHDRLRESAFAVAIGAKRTCPLHRLCPLMTQSGHASRGAEC